MSKSSIVLPDSKQEVALRSMSWDQQEAYQKKLAEANPKEADTVPSIQFHDVLRWVVEEVYPGKFEELRGSFRDVKSLAMATIAYTFSDPEEEKN